MSSGATSQLLKIYMAQSPDSDGVDEFALRKQTQCDRILVWMTRRRIPSIGSWQHTLLRIFDSPTFSMLVVGMTILALFLVDISILATNDPSIDQPVAGIIFVCFIFFLLEILGSIAVQDDYFLSFFFLCDAIGTLSLIFDIPWLSEPLGLHFSGGSVAVLRASRIARTGTRATRVLRLLRTMRMPALLRCCKHADEDLIEEEEETRQLRENKANPTSSPSSSPSHASASASAASSSKQPHSNNNNNSSSGSKQQQQAALATQQIVNTNVGSKLQLVVSKRVIFLVTIMIFVIPLLTETDVDHSRTMGLNLIESTVSLQQSVFYQNSTLFDTLFDTYLLNLQSQQSGKNIYIQVYDMIRPSDTGYPNTNGIRGAALINITSDSRDSYALFDQTQALRQTSLLSLGMTIFTIILFAGGSILFTQDAERLFFKPIERMIKTIKRLASIIFEIDQSSNEVAVDETLLIEAVVGRISDLFNVRLDRDGIKRKTTYMKTSTSLWRIYIEEEECTEPVDMNQSVKNRDLLLIHEIEELASVSRCLESAICTSYLSQYLRHEYCLENILFLQELRSYKYACEKLKHHSSQIYNLFISDQAINQVNLSWILRRTVAQNLKTQMSYLSQVFDDVEREILLKLSNDIFPRFLNSIYCLKLLKHLTLERRAQKLKEEKELMEQRRAQGIIPPMQQPHLPPGLHQRHHTVHNPQQNGASTAAGQNAATPNYEVTSLARSEDEMPGSRIQMEEMKMIRHALDK